jgi:hypothetical protein
MTSEDALKKLNELKPWLASQGVVRTRLFGSFARDQANDKSDIDLIVDLDRTMGLEFFGIEYELSQMLGRDVQIVTEADLHTLIRDDVRAYAVDA